MKRRWVIVAISSIVLIGAGTLVQTARKNRQLAKDATAFGMRAEQGDAEAQFKLGSIYSKGKGVPKDFVEAVRWYRKAADQGFAPAQDNLGTMYADGRGVAQDYVEAARWYRKAADQGNALAEFNLGAKYDNGQGVPQGQSRHRASRGRQVVRVGLALHRRVQQDIQPRCQGRCRIAQNPDQRGTKLPQQRNQGQQLR